ncbi:MAG: hypothetical protein U1D26_00790 [Patescibacteria group bacterium]|nr:hypothetical protein [bacterium]MDZ4226994.1 hypothetical protein [Patescibacteria group bacterium]
MYHLPLASIRVLVALAGLFGVLWGPWWLTAAAIVLLSARFRAWEALMLGLLADLIWLPAGSLWEPIPLFTLGAIVAVWAFEPLRSKFLLRT